MKVELERFNTISCAIDAAYHEAAVKMGLSDSEMIILYVFCEVGSGCNQSALYKMTGIGKSTINSSIRKMEKSGLLYLEKGNGRNTRAFLTPAGDKLMQNTVQKLIQIENDIFDSWSKEEQASFIRLNEKYLEAFKKQILNL